MAHHYGLSIYVCVCAVWMSEFNKYVRARSLKSNSYNKNRSVHRLATVFSFPSLCMCWLAAAAEALASRSLSFRLAACLYAIGVM